MPRVPTSDGPQLRVNPLNPVRQQNIDVSSGAQALARGVGQVGAAFDQIAEREDQTLADQTDAQITSAWLKWDAENRNKYRGQNVDGYEAAAQEWWKTAAEQYGKDLSPRARSLASRSLVRKQGTALANVTQFVGQEKERFADESAAANIATTIQFGVTSGDVAGASQQVREHVAMIGARKGWTTEQVQAEQLKNLSALHLAQITKMAETNAEAAQEYYDKNKAEVGFQNQARVEQVLKGEADNQFATQKAAEWAGLPLSEQLAEAAKITDPQRREKTLAQVRNNYALVKQAEQERENTAADQAWQAYAQGGRIPESVLSQMSGRERVQLQDSMRSRAERAAAGRKVTTDWNVYIDARERLAAGETVDLRALTEKVAPGQLEQLLDIQTRAKSPGKQVEVATSEQQMSSYVDSLKLGGAKNAEKRGKFKAAAQDIFNEHLKRTGKEPTFDERQAILDKLTTDVVLKKGWIWDDTGPAYEQPRDKLREDFGQQPAPTTARTSAAVRVNTIEQARALPKGTRFIDPQGVERIR